MQKLLISLLFFGTSLIANNPLITEQDIAKKAFEALDISWEVGLKIIDDAVHIHQIDYLKTLDLLEEQIKTCIECNQAQYNNRLNYIKSLAISATSFATALGLGYLMWRSFKRRDAWYDKQFAEKIAKLALAGIKVTEERMIDSHKIIFHRNRAEHPNAGLLIDKIKPELIVIRDQQHNWSYRDLFDIHVWTATACFLGLSLASTISFDNFKKASNPYCQQNIKTYSYMLQQLEESKLRCK